MLKFLDVSVLGGDVFVLLLSITFIVGLLSFVNFRWQRRRIYECFEKIPGDNGVPVLGHALEFAADPSEYFKV